jgi:SAM-dependent methyltransferase
VNHVRQPHAVQDLPSRRCKGEKMLRLLALPPREAPWRVLEVGTGSGGIAHYLATHPSARCDVTSVDVVDVRGIRDGYAFQLVDGTTLPFGDGAFDIVITNHVIEHVGELDAQRAHLAECRRVMAPAGRGYFAMPNRWMLVEPHFKLAFLSWLPRRVSDAYVRLAGKGTHYDCRPMSRPRIEAELRRAGFAFVQHTGDALNLTYALEAPRAPLYRYVLAPVPDTAWRMLRSAFPTLIYTLRAASNASPDASHVGSTG